MIILGIDPGIARTGYGAIEKLSGKKSKKGDSFKCLGCGVIKTLPSSKMPDRLKKLNNELSALIKAYRPEVLVVESIYFFKNLKTAIPVSQAKGVILLTAAKNNIPVSEFTPLQVKIALTKFGRAEKEDVREKTKILLNLKEIPGEDGGLDDTADALAVALTQCLYVRKTS